MRYGCPSCNNEVERTQVMCFDCSTNLVVNAPIALDDVGEPSAAPSAADTDVHRVVTRPITDHAAGAAGRAPASRRAAAAGWQIVGPDLALDITSTIRIGRDTDWATHGLARRLASSLDVSRRHAELRLEGDQLVVADVESMNGTLVDGVAVQPGAPRHVRDGDELRFSDQFVVRAVRR